jgi:hypothetical protein
MKPYEVVCPKCQANIQLSASIIVELEFSSEVNITCECGCVITLINEPNFRTLAFLTQLNAPTAVSRNLYHGTN